MVDLIIFTSYVIIWSSWDFILQILLLKNKMNVQIPFQNEFSANFEDLNPSDTNEGKTQGIFDN